MTVNPESDQMLDRDWEDLVLESFGEATPEVLQFFEDHSVFTVGALLGSTKGLTVPIQSEGPSQEVLGAFFDHLLEILPASLLETYRTY